MSERQDASERSAWTEEPKDLRLLIGQCFLCGFEGKTIPDALLEALRAGDCGGVILFSRNLGTPDDILALNRQIREAAWPLPPWIGVDQEGGRVQRLRAPFTELPPAAILGQEDDEEVARRYGRIIGEETAAAGFNLVFAPVLDVHTNPANPVIGDRALATDAAQVARLALAKAAGLMEAGVMPCGKHFPGHGDTDQDSHLTLPIIGHPRERLERVEWVPFQAAVRAKIPAIMSAHVLFPALDPVYPATLSIPILRGLLRESWGYDGLVISDDLEMKGVAAHYEIEEIVTRGILAGIDLFLLCKVWEVLPRAIQALLHAVQEGVISEERLRASWRRIRDAKRRFAAPSAMQPPRSMSDYLAAQEQHRSEASRLFARWLSHTKA